MNAVLVANADRMMTSAGVVEDGIAVTFADGSFGIIPFEALQDVNEPSAITSIELPNPYELHLVAEDGKHPEIPWDFARHFCDAYYRQRVEELALRGRQLVGFRIRQYRKTAGLTQVALARAAGIGRVTLLRIEKGEQIARFKTLSAIAQAVGRPVIDLFLEPEAADSTTNVPQYMTEDSTPNYLENIELAAWSENLKRHTDELTGLDATSNEVFLGIKHVIDGFEALLTDSKNEPEVALVEEGLHLAARIFKGIRAAKVIGEMGYYEQAMVLARSCLEHLLVVCDLPLSETTRKTLKRGGQFNFSNGAMVNRVDQAYPDLRFKERWEMNYPQLSKRVHPSGTRLQQLPLPSGEVGYVIPFTNYYDQSLAMATIEVIWGELRLLTHLLQGMAIVVRNEWDATGAYRALEQSIPKEKIPS